MDVGQLSVEGAFVIRPEIHRDLRGSFAEVMTRESLLQSVDFAFDVAQINVSTSVGGVIRGIHGTSEPHAQHKYVTCVSGAILDVVVDLRPQSPSFGSWESVILDDQAQSSLFVAQHLGHAFQALTPSAIVCYATNARYSPAHEFSINALDPDLGIPWRPNIIQSERDRNAPSLREWKSALNH